MQRAVPTPAPARPYAPRGMLAAIDLHGCESGRLADPDNIRAFIPAVIDAIGMRAHGPLALDRFGDGELEGWSAMPFHRDQLDHDPRRWVSGRCFIDAFSCREFDAEIAAAIARADFGGTPTVTVLER